MIKINKEQEFKIFNKYEDDYIVYPFDDDGVILRIIDYMNKTMIDFDVDENSDTPQEVVDNELNKLNDTFEEFESTCCACKILRRTDGVFFCGNCMKQVEYAFCPYCDSDGDIRIFRGGYKKCDECGGTKRIQL